MLAVIVLISFPREITLAPDCLRDTVIAEFLLNEKVIAFQKDASYRGRLEQVKGHWIILRDKDSCLDSLAVESLDSIRVFLPLEYYPENRGRLMLISGCSGTAGAFVGCLAGTTAGNWWGENLIDVLVPATAGGCFLGMTIGVFLYDQGASAEKREKTRVFLAIVKSAGVVLPR